MRRESNLNDNCLTLGLMAKFWEPGRVKTRLGNSIGMRRAARIHRIFATYLCETLRTSADRRLVSLSPIERQADFQSALDETNAGAAWSFIDQGTGELGDRMKRWFSQCLTGRNSRAILLGADCPTIRPELISSADQWLMDHPIVLGPARDGGYYLIGLCGRWEDHHDRFESLFRDIPWSTPEVFELTRTRAAAAGLSIAALETGEDVDTIVELNNLLASLGERDAELRSAIEKTMTDPTLADSA